MLALPAPEAQAEPSRLPFCLRPQVIRVFGAVCKFLVELVIMILYLPPGTPATPRNLALAGARGCVYLVISGLGYSLVLTIQTQGDPDQATWITSTVSDALGVPNLDCQPLVRQKRGALDFLFTAEELPQVITTLPPSILEANLTTPILKNETRPDAPADNVTSYPTLNQSLEQKNSTWAPARMPNSTLLSSSQPTLSPEELHNLEVQVEQAWAETKEKKKRLEEAEVKVAFLQKEVDGAQLEIDAAVREVHQTTRTCERNLDRYKTRLDHQMDLVNRSKLEASAAIEEKYQTTRAYETKVDQLQVKLNLQVDLVAQYEKFLTNKEERLEELSEELENQTKTVKMLQNAVKTQQDHKEEKADCLKASTASVIAGTVEVPNLPPTPVTKETADMASLLPPPLTVGWHEVVGLILLVLILGTCSLLVGKCLGARKRQAKLRLDQQLVLPGSAINKPILKRVQTVGKKQQETLQELDALSAP